MYSAFRKYAYTAVTQCSLILFLSTSIHADNGTSNEELIREVKRGSYGAAEILAEKGDQSVVPVLISALQEERQKKDDSIPQVKSAIILALGRLKNPAAARVLVSSLADDAAADQARSALISIGEPAVQEISSIFNNERFDGSKRATALSILGKIGSPQAVEVIANQIGSDLSRKAVRELLSSDETMGLTILSEKLKDPQIPGDDKIDIIKIIHRHASATKNTRKTLESALTTDSNDVHVKIYAQAALAEIGVSVRLAQTDIPSLVEALFIPGMPVSNEYRPTQGVQLHALKALKEMGDPAIQYLTREETTSSKSGYALSYLAEESDALRKSLAKILLDKNENVHRRRTIAFKIFGRMKSDESQSLMEQILRDNSEDIYLRYYAASALVDDLGKKQYLSYAIEWLNDERLRNEAVQLIRGNREAEVSPLVGEAIPEFDHERNSQFFKLS